MKHLTCGGKYQLHQLTSLVMLLPMLFLKGRTKTWYLTFDKMADECCALTANIPVNLQICRTQPEPGSEGSGSVRVRHIDGFGSVRVLNVFST